MKMIKNKIVIVLLITCFVLAPVGCGKKNNTETETAKVINETKKIEIENNDDTKIPEATLKETLTETKANTQADQENAADPEVDVDLTALSSILIFSEVNNMMIKPDRYMGKTIKMSGQYYHTYYEETGQYYHYVIIADATACCEQGLEFIWNGEHTFPDAYPEEGTNVEVEGVFGSYEELGVTYYYIATDDVKIVD